MYAPSPTIYSATLALPFEKAEQVVRAVLRAQEFHIDTVIDVQRQFREAFGIDSGARKLFGISGRRKSNNENEAPFLVALHAFEDHTFVAASLSPLLAPCACKDSKSEEAMLSRVIALLFPFELTP